MDLRALTTRIRNAAPSCGDVRVVAIDGPSGAGKSTFARALSEAATAPVIGTDEFPVPWNGDVLAWWPEADRLLHALAKGRPATYRPYDWRTRRYADAKTVPVTGILILEGVGAAWKGAPAAFRIWIDAPYETRRRRALARDGEALLPAWEAWSRREEGHFAADRTRERADLAVGAQDVLDATSASAAPNTSVLWAPDTAH